MDFSMMQSLGKYTKTMEMQMKWQQKKKNNDFTADGSTKIKDATAWQAEQIRKSQADGSARLSTQIRTKLSTGKKLTKEEMDYLQKNDPQLYQKAKSIEAEQKSYEKELSNCKTKEDVERVRTNRIAASLSVVKSVENNSAIPEGAKLGLIVQELAKNMALEETLNKFVASGRYAKLPTEAEKLKAEKDLKEAKEAEPEVKAPAENTEENAAAENSAGAEQADGEISADKADGTELREAVQERRMTRAEAEITPEAMKVKHSKVQAAYKRNQAELPAQMMDIKVE